MASFWGELRRRNVFKVAVAYAIVGWILVEVASTILPTFEAPHWVLQTITFVVILGFPLALIFAWAFELTPEGLKKSHEVDPEHSVTHITGRKLNYSIIGFLGVALAISISLNYLDDKSAEGIADTGIESMAAASSEKEVAIPSIAVLPFNNMSGDPAQEFIADGLTEDLITDLAQSAIGLRVIARTSTFAYKGQSPDARQVGKELGVRYVVEGSVRKMGDRIRINAQLIEAKTGEHQWAERFDRRWADFFEVQDELIRGIVKALGYELAEAEIVRAMRPEDPNALDAWTLGFRAWGLFRRSHSADSLKEVVRLLRQALALQPDWAWLHGDLAVFLGEMVRNGWSDDPEADIAEVWAHGRQAVSLAPNDPFILFKSGKVHQVFGTQKEAIDIFEHALELDPELSPALHFLPQSYARLGRPQEALELVRKHLRLDPKEIDNWADHNTMSICHVQLESYAEAEVASRRAVRSNESMIWIWQQLAVVLVARGRIEEAKAAMAEARRIDPNYTFEQFEEVFRPYYPDQADQVMAWARQAWGD